MTNLGQQPRADGQPGAEQREIDAVHAIVGRGIEFPLAVHQGGLGLSSADDLSSSIRLIIMTSPGERRMRPEFGCAIWDHVFAPINAATLGQMEHAVRMALSRWEPRIDVDDVRVEPADDVADRAAVRIGIDYRIRSSNDHRNLVFPFYVIPESESR